MDTATLMWGVVFGSIGLGYALYGKKQQSAMPLICGIALIALPYFIASVLWLVIVGVILAVLPFIVRD